MNNFKYERILDFESLLNWIEKTAAITLDEKTELFDSFEKIIERRRTEFLKTIVYDNDIKDNKKECLDRFS